MIELLKQVEETPDAYPDAPDGLSEKAALLDADMIWQRIEAYTAYRFSEREVIWIVEGSTGAVLKPALTPLISQMAEIWLDGTWEPITLLDAPIGVCLQMAGTYRIMAQVGAGPVPAAVAEAFRRLAEYSAGIGEHAGLSFSKSPAGAAGFETSLDGLSAKIERSATWTAKALQNSGAADLLRPYRRA